AGRGTGRDHADGRRGRIGPERSNPVERRDGPMAIEAQQKGAGPASAEFLAGTPLVRAFNSIPAAGLRNEANRTPERIANPLAGAGAEAPEDAGPLVPRAGSGHLPTG